MSYKYIIYEKEGEVARITINKPDKLNTLTFISIGEDFYVIPYNTATMTALNEYAAKANFATLREDYDENVAKIMEIIDANGIDANRLIQSECSYIVQDNLTRQVFL